MKKDFLSIIDCPADMLEELLLMSARLKSIYAAGGSDLCLSGKTLAMIARGMEGYSISVFQGKGGLSGDELPLLNGEPITEHSTRLNEHDIIEISSFQMEFVYLH